jgi:Lamin Tail Domain
MMEQINSFILRLKTLYSQQGRTGKILLPSLVLLASCCLCSLSISLFSSGLRNSPITPGPNVLPSVGIAATPTALFNFDFATFTPFPTLPPSTALPTLTPLPTETPTSTQTVPTATGTPLPTMTATQPPATVPITGSVRIVTMDKAMEYVELQNVGNAPVDLTGWKLVSETGSQSCTLRGVLQPNEVLRVWARKGDPGLSCGFSFNIWNDSQADPAVLYNAQGEEVSRFP